MFNQESIKRHVYDRTGQELTVAAGQDIIAAFGEFVITNSEVADQIVGELPPAQGGSAAYNSQDLEYHIRGACHANIIHELIENRYGRAQPLDILDFGCGAGRLIKYFAFFDPKHRYRACEVNPHAVDLVKRVLPEVDSRRINSAPPTTFESESMDVVFAWSIWTHFSEAISRSWLEEVHRLLKPSGLALITLHTDELVERYGIEPQLVAKMKERGGDYSKIRETYDETGFCYWDAYPERARQFGIDNTTFGMAFVSVDYVKRKWTDLFDFKGSVVGAPRWQDVMILTKK